MLFQECAHYGKIRFVHSPNVRGSCHHASNFTMAVAFWCPVWVSCDPPHEECPALPVCGWSPQTSSWMGLCYVAEGFLASLGMNTHSLEVYCGRALHKPDVCASKRTEQCEGLLGVRLVIPQAIGP